jgi:hypothetical protein
MIAEGIPEGRGEFTLTLKLAAKNQVTGMLRSTMGEGDISDGTFNPKTKRLTFGYDAGQGMFLDFTATISGNRMTGEGDSGVFKFEFEAARRDAVVATGAKAEQRPARHEGKPLGELIPGPRWVSSIETSRFKDGRVYIALDGHRSDDDEPYIFVSEDYGQTWCSLRANLPTEVGSTRVIREDIENPDLLYLGTEFGLYASVDRGDSWTRLNSNLPTVAVHEVAIHPTAGEIVAATHGRSLWVLDVTSLRQMIVEAREAEAHLYEPNTAIHWRLLPGRGGHGIRSYAGENPPDGVRLFYSLKEQPRRISLKVKDLYGETVREFEPENSPGLHKVSWNLRREPEQDARGRRPRRGRLVPAGRYLVELTVGKQILRQELRVETDPEYPDYRPWAVERSEATLEEAEYDDTEVQSSPDVIDL